MRSVSWMKWAIGFGALTVLAVMEGCGGDDGPAGPGPGSEVADEHAVAAAFEGVGMMMGVARLSPFWAAGILATIGREPAGAQSDPVYDDGQQAWVWTYTRSFSSEAVTQTADQDYKLQYIGSGGPQEDFNGATSISVVFGEAFSMVETDLDSPELLEFTTTMDIDLNVLVTGIPDGLLNVAVDGSATGQAGTTVPAGTTTVNFPTFTFDGSFQECTSTTSHVDFAPYSVDVVMQEDGNGSWELLKNGLQIAAPLGPVGSEEYFMLCIPREGGGGPVP